PGAQIYTLSLRDALPIAEGGVTVSVSAPAARDCRLYERIVHASRRKDSAFSSLRQRAERLRARPHLRKRSHRFARTTCSRALREDRKSTRLNSSHVKSSY